MTLSASATDLKKIKIRKTVWVFLGITAFCILFSTVYEHFGHGVYSNAMIFLFTYPLVGGVLVFGLLGLIKKAPFPGRVCYNLYNSGIAALASGSCFTGVLEIYGTDSDLVMIYWVAGIILTAAGVVAYLLSLALKLSTPQ